MNLPSKHLYKETLSGILQVPVNSDYRSDVEFGMLPADVLSRKDILPVAKLVLAGLGLESKGTGFVAASDGAISEIVGCSRPAVFAARRQLTEVRLIEPYGKPVGQVQAYRLLHPRMISAAAEGKAVGTRDRRRRTQYVMCSGCHRFRPALGKDGVCRTCKSERKTERISERVARKVVREEIGA